MSGAAHTDGLVVVKVGGSLYDLPDFGPRLRGWLQTMGAAAVLLVPGGGPTADVVRALDRAHGLGEEASHWLALRALTLNAYFLQSLLPGAVVVVDPHERPFASGCVAVLDAFGFAQADEARAGRLPHCWGVTSDSLAARAAVVAAAQELILLKSVPVPRELTWEEAARRGLVDEWFARVVAQEPAGSLAVRCVAFRGDSGLVVHCS
jgi:aspartokinase-like uncharacterized kinase